MQDDDQDGGQGLAMGVGVGIAMGSGVGTALGAAFDNIGLGAGIGVALGTAFWSVSRGKSNSGPRSLAAAFVCSAFDPS